MELGELKEQRLEELKKLKIQLSKDEDKRKILYAENELKMIKEDSKRKSVQIFIGLAVKYSIESEDLNVIMEIAPFL